MLPANNVHVLAPITQRRTLWASLLPIKRLFEVESNEIPIGPFSCVLPNPCPFPPATIVPEVAPDKYFITRWLAYSAIYSVPVVRSRDIPCGRLSWFSAVPAVPKNTPMYKFSQLEERNAWNEQRYGNLTKAPCRKGWAFGIEKPSMLCCRASQEASKGALERVLWARLKETRVDLLVTGEQRKGWPSIDHCSPFSSAKCLLARILYVLFCRALHGRQGYVLDILSRPVLSSRDRFRTGTTELVNQSWKERAKPYSCLSSKYCCTSYGFTVEGEGGWYEYGSFEMNID